MSSATIASNLEQIDSKIAELNELRMFIKKEVNKTAEDYKKRMALAELLKSLLDVDKTILAYLKESNSVLYKIDRDKDSSNGDNKEKRNTLLQLMTTMNREVQDEIDDLKQNAEAI